MYLIDYRQVGVLGFWGCSERNEPAGPADRITQLTREMLLLPGRRGGIIRRLVPALAPASLLLCAALGLLRLQLLSELFAFRFADATGAYVGLDLRPLAQVRRLQGPANLLGSADLL